MSSPCWVTAADACVDIKLGTGMAAYEPKTVVEVFKATVAKHGSRPAMQVKIPVDGKVPDDWKVWTWQQYWDDCIKFAKSLVFLNVNAFKVINIIGFNSPEWFIANCGAIVAGGIAAGIYTTNTAEACEYVSSSSAAEVVVLEGNKQLAKYAGANTKLPSLKCIVVWGEAIDEDTAKAVGVPVHTFEAFMNLGASVEDNVITARTADVMPGHCSTLIYTSGTTGKPKGCMISHDNVTWTTRVILETYVPMNHTERCVSYLPLSHIAAQIIDIHASISLGSCVYFAQKDALKGTLTHTLKEVLPTYFFGVPRVWEKIQEKMTQMARETVGVKKSISTWAKSVGAEHSRLAQYENRNETASIGHNCAYTLANAAVMSKVKAALGLSCSKMSFTAAAPISVSTLQYFASLDMPIFEMYGTSECSGPHTASGPGEWRMGYCGRAIPSTLCKLNPNTGELAIKGRNIFMGYLNMPEKTASTFDDEGYLLTGDISAFDEFNKPDVETGPSGFMRIIGRCKDLIITAGGENVPPALIEHQMQTAMLALSNCLVVGDRRPFLLMFIALKCVIDPVTGEPTDALAKDALFVASQIGSSATTVSEAANCDKFAKYFDEGMAAGNSHAASEAQFIKKWSLLPVDFSEKAGDLTPTLKVKHNVVTARLSDKMDEIYGGPVVK